MRPVRKPTIKKLSIKKETVRELGRRELDLAAGGLTGTETKLPSCLPSLCCTPDLQ